MPCEQNNTSHHQKRLRLAFVIDCIGGWNLGGTEKQLAHLAKTLDKKIFEPAIFVLQPTPGATDRDVGCPVFIVNPPEVKSRIRTFLNLRAALKRFQPHVVQTFFVDGTFYGTLAAWLNHVPIIVQSRRNAGHWLRPHHSLALRVIKRAVDYWQCNSQFVAGMLVSQEGIPREQVTVLPNSIDTSRFSPRSANEKRDLRAGLGLQQDVPIFIVVSTLRPIKGLPLVIDAAARMRARLPGALFLLVGEGPERASLEERVISLGLHDTVRFIGGQEDVRPWLAIADIAVLPSHSESSSNALLEYMAMGLPAVVSDIPANRELVGGEFFPAGDGAALAEKLSWLWHHKEKRWEMAVQYRETALQYSQVSVAECAQKFYLDLASIQPKAIKERGASGCQ